MWPAPQDFEEEIQNPYTCFRDPELREGYPELTSLGFPKPRSGNFSTVYKIQSTSGKWAVKCFSREIADKCFRYAAIKEYLRETNLPNFIDFDFQDEGILVRGDWYPILKMEWVDGESLDMYISRNIHKPHKLSELAHQFAAMMANLNHWNISHGDLHHHNILIMNGQIRLIDYDGMFVPTLAGMMCQEIGHTHYQHPLRTPYDFGPFLDHFPAWILFITLKALSIDPSLWLDNSDKDKYLLLGQKDFLDPETSEVVQRLEKLENVGTYLYLSQWRSFCYHDVTQIPPLFGNDRKRPVNKPFFHQETAVLQDTMEPIVKIPSFKNPSWVLDHLPDTAMKTTEYTLWPERVLLLSAIVVNPWHSLITLSHSLKYSFLILFALLLTFRYFTNPFIRKKREIIFSLIDLYIKKHWTKFKFSSTHRKTVSRIRAQERIREAHLHKLNQVNSEIEQCKNKLKYELYKQSSPLSLKRQKLNTIRAGEAEGQQPLLHQQIALKQKYYNQLKDVVKAYEPTLHPVADQFHLIQQNLDTSRETMKQDISEFTRQISAFSWQIEIKKHQLQPLKNVNFLFYVKQIILLRKGEKKSLT